MTLLGRALPLFVLLSSSIALADGPKTTIYFTRHLNDQSKWVDAGTGVQHDTCIDNRKCCEQVLNPLGVERSNALARWFDEQHITRTLDRVIATSKPRTVASVVQIAQAAGLHNDVDLVADGVQQIPADQIECDIHQPQYYDATATMQPLYDYIRALPQGTTALVATHSTTLYQIFYKLGINVLSDTTFFPLDIPAGATTCDPSSIAKSGPLNSRGCKVLGFNNLWKVVIDKDGNATATDHWVLDTSLNDKNHDHVGLGCNQPDDHDDNGN